MKITTINLFQFCNPNFSYYTKKEKFKKEDWHKKITWLNEKINKLNSDIIVFQEVFSYEDLKEICTNNALKYFCIVDEPQLQNKTYQTCVVALASKYPIIEIQNINHDKNFSFARKPIKAKIKIKNEELIVYAVHLKSNRLNEFEHKFTINSSFEEKFTKNNSSLNNKTSALFQRFNEVKYLNEDINESLKTNKNIIIAGDFNDKLYSFCLEILKSNDYLQEILNYEKSTKIKTNYKSILFDAYEIFSKNDYKNRKYTSYFLSVGNVIDFILLSENLKNITDYKVDDEHLKDNKNGSLLKSDHAIVTCTLNL